MHALVSRVALDTVPVLSPMQVLGCHFAHATTFIPNASNILQLNGTPYVSQTRAKLNNVCIPYYFITIGIRLITVKIITL